jgi:glutathione S-transferase
MRGPTLKLYGHVNRLSPSTLKLRVALAEADAVYEFHPVDLGRGEQLASEFLALNPHGKIPVLVEDDFVLPESDAILFYLAERYQEAKLLGTTPRERARALQWCGFAATALYPAYYDVYFHTASGPPERRLPQVAEGARKRFDRALTVMDRVLADGSFLSDGFSIADIACASVLRAARERVPYRADDHTAIEAWYARVTSRPSWKASVTDSPTENAPIAAPER